MTAPKTLLELSGADLRPPRLRDAALVMIDLQNEYLAGPIALPDARSAIANAAKLLARARDGRRCDHPHRPQGTPRRTVRPRRPSAAPIVSALAPLPDEPVIEKGLPNAFAGTDLQAQLTAIGRKDLVLAGFMTHMCISSTARAGLDLGYRITVDADSCATRDLPDGRGGDDRGRQHSRRRARGIVRPVRDHRPRRDALV